MRNIKPPLPFVGHKGHWGSELTEIARNLPPETIVFDVFGGSGICAHYIKAARPDLTVVWNDFDNYRRRLDNIQKTENLRQFFLQKFGLPVAKNTFIPPLDEHSRQLVFDTLNAARFFVDMHTISRWFYLYSAKTNKLVSSSGKLYNRVPVKPYNLERCASWLRDCVRVDVEFLGLDTPFELSAGCVRPRDFIQSQNALFIFDPPYLGTGCNDYGNKDSLRVLRSVADSCERLPFLLFGDSSIAFWYELLFKGRKFRKYERTINNIGQNHKLRSEILFACLPGER